MSLPRLRSNRWVIWLTSAIMLMAALAPAVSRGLAWANAAPQWVELCSAVGVQRVQVSDAATGQADTQKPPGGAAVDHCPLCVVSAERPTLPSAQVEHQPVLADGLAYELPVYAPPAFSTRFLLPAAPRGPPAALANTLLA